MESEHIWAMCLIWLERQKEDNLIKAEGLGKIPIQIPSDGLSVRGTLFCSP